MTEQRSNNLITATSIVIPAKNEVQSIADVIRRTLRAVPNAEVIVVDDGSSDATADVARNEGAIVISHPYSKGNGASIKSGARHASREFLVFMDGDGQHSPEDIPRLLEPLTRGYDMVVGARDRDSQASTWRGAANMLYNRLASYITNHDIKDLTSGFRAVRAKRFKEFIYLLPNGFSYPTTCTMAFFRAGYSVLYEPIKAAQRKGKSHIHPLRDGSRFLLIIFKIGTLFSPLKIFAPVALAMFALASVWYGWTWWNQGRFTNMSALLYTGSVMVFLMGLISEQITALMYKDSS